MSEPLRLLTIQHQPDCPPGRVGQWLAESLIRLDVVRPDLGMPLPAELRGYAGMLVLGGSMSAGDDDTVPWLISTKRLLRSAVDIAMPVLGLCLGHQLLAAATGGRVEPNPAGRRTGVARMELDAAALFDPLFSRLRWPAIAPRWHADIVVEMPPDGTVLATADRDVVYGMVVGERAWGVQAHPEATPSIVERWAERAVVEIGAGGRSAELHADVRHRLAGVQLGLRQIRSADPQMEPSWRPFVEAFAGQVATYRVDGGR